MFRHLNNVQVQLDVRSPVAVGGVLFVAAFTKGGTDRAIGTGASSTILSRIVYVGDREFGGGAAARQQPLGADGLVQRPEQETTMPNPGQPTIRLGAAGNVVRRLQRALRRTPTPG